MRLYLSANPVRNRQVREVLDSYGVHYECVSIHEIQQEHILEMMRCTVDCFEFLTPSCLLFKRRKDLPLSQLVSFILENRTKALRLPLVIDKNHIYPDISQDDLRTFLPRGIKKRIQEELRMHMIV